MSNEHGEPVFKSGFVTLIGRPNAGKSTLANNLVGKKIAITSSTAQTTRQRLFAIRDSDHAQIVFIDTPGLHKPHDPLGEELNRSAIQALHDVDLACLVIAGDSPVGKGDAWVASHLTKLSTPCILVITKGDLIDERAIERRIAEAKQLMSFSEVVVVSGTTGKGVKSFVQLVESYLPEGPRWFPEGVTTDQPFETIAAEFIREKVLLHTREEVPHAVGVLVEDDEYDEEQDLTTIRASIFVERESQKGIIIGKRGVMIKRIGSEARRDLQKLLGGRVYLDLLVKVKRDWRQDMNQIKLFGYGEGL